MDGDCGFFLREEGERKMGWMKEGKLYLLEGIFSELAGHYRFFVQHRKKGKNLFEKEKQEQMKEVEVEARSLEEGRKKIRI